MRIQLSTICNTYEDGKCANNSIVLTFDHEFIDPLINFRYTWKCYEILYKKFEREPYFVYLNSSKYKTEK